MRKNEMQKTIIEGYRISSQQKRIWVLRSGEGDYKVWCAVVLEGRVDDDLLKEAVERVCARYEILRTGFECFTGMEIPVQVIRSKAVASFLKEEATSNFDNGSYDIENILGEVTSRSSEDEATFRVHVVLVKISESRNLLIIELPALYADGRSLKIFVSEVMKSYGRIIEAEGESADPIQYADYCEWQRELMESDIGEASRLYWQEQLKMLEGGEYKLPLERRAVREENGGPKPIIVHAKPETVKRVIETAEKYAVTIAEVLLTAWGVLLGRLTRTNQVTIGNLYDGRKYDVLQDTIGLFAEYLPVTFRLQEELQFIETLENVGESLRAAYSRGEYFSHDLYETNNDGTDVSRPSVGFDYDEWSERQCFGGINVHFYRCDAVIDYFKLRLSVTRVGKDIRCQFHYDPRRYRRQTIERLTEQYLTILESGVDEPHRPIEQLEILGSRERELLRKWWRPRRKERPSGPTLAEMFQEQVSAKPEAIAVVCAEQAVTYRELNRRANRAAQRLIGKGVGAESVVGVCLGRSIEMITSVIGILKAGGAYLPIDPRQPQARVREMLEACGVKVVIGKQEAVGMWAGLEVEVAESEGECAEAEAGGDEDPGRRAGVKNAAYVIYTSGTTGRPKGVVIEQRGVINLLAGLEEEIYQEAGQGLRVSLNAPLSFDASVKQVMQLMKGHSLWIVPEEVRGDGRALVRALNEQSIEVLDVTPSQLRLMLEAGLEAEAGEYPRVVLVGGEALDEESWRQMSGKRRKYYNVYGPTECTVDATVGRVEGARVYRSGDLVRYEEDGSLRHVGRGDRQVKLRGYRIEPREIERVLEEHGGVREAVVVVKGERPEEQRLVAYLVAERNYLKNNQEKVRYKLPNNMSIVHQNNNETRYLYQEIFEKQTYLKYGIRLCEGACVFDVGANIGMFSLFVSRYCQNPRIYAFEPIQQIYEMLKINMDLYGNNVKVFQMGLGNEEKMERFIYYPGYSMMSCQAVYANTANDIEVIKTYLKNEQKRGLDVEELIQEADEILAHRFKAETGFSRIRRLSNVIKSERVEKIDLLKIDVQGAELDVLQGINNDDWNEIGQLVMEVHDAEGTQTQGRLEVIKAMLEARGYEVTIEQDALLEKTDRYNLYALSREWAEKHRTRENLKSLSAMEDSEPELTVDNLRKHTAERLPEYMLPAAYIIMDQFPLTRHGKIDRGALPEPEQALRESRGRRASDIYQEMLTGIWEEVLGVENIGVEEDFFELGGHSLLATQLMSRVREAFGVELELRCLFEEP